MEFLDLAKKRYTERRYSERPVESEKLEKILEAGRLSPTAKNMQPERIYVLKSQEAREKIQETYYKDYDAGEMDASIVATMMMMEAADLGVASVWAKYYDTQKLIDEFKLPSNIRPVMLLSLGYPNDKSDGNKATHFSRKDISEIVVEL